MRSIGADDVIDYTREDFTDGSRTWDVIVDTAGRRPLRQLRRALDAEGHARDRRRRRRRPLDRRLLPRDAPRADPVDVRRSDARRVIAKTTDEDLAGAAGLIEAGSVTPVVDRTFDLVEAADAVRYLAEGHAAGKIVVTV